MTAKTAKKIIFLRRPGSGQAHLLSCACPQPGSFEGSFGSSGASLGDYRGNFRVSYELVCSSFGSYPQAHFRVYPCCEPPGDPADPSKETWVASGVLWAPPPRQTLSPHPRHRNPPLLSLAEQLSRLCKVYQFSGKKVEIHR